MHSEPDIISGFLNGAKFFVSLITHRKAKVSDAAENDDGSRQSVIGHKFSFTIVQVGRSTEILQLSCQPKSAQH